MWLKHCYNADLHCLYIAKNTFGKNAIAKNFSLAFAIWLCRPQLCVTAFVYRIYFSVNDQKDKKKIMEFFLALTQKENFHFTSLVWTYIIKVPFTVKNPKLCKMGLRVLKCPKKLTCLT